MFYVFASSRKNVSAPRDNNAQQQTLFHIFKQSRFGISLLLISSYLILLVIPVLITPFCLITQTTLPRGYILYRRISVALSDTADAMIYVFISPAARKLLLHKIISLLTTTVTPTLPTTENTHLRNIRSIPRHEEEGHLPVTPNHIKISSI